MKSLMIRSIALLLQLSYSTCVNYTNISSCINANIDDTSIGCQWCTIDNNTNYSSISMCIPLETDTTYNDSINNTNSNNISSISCISSLSANNNTKSLLQQQQ